MATEITYNGAVIATPEAGQTATLKCKGMVMADDVVVKAGSGGGVIEDWFNDGNTHLWVTIHEGRTSTELFTDACLNGIVTVYWGDGTRYWEVSDDVNAQMPRTAKNTYASAGDYIITLVVEGELKLRSCPLTEGTIKKIEVGGGVTLDNNCFNKHYGLESVKLHDGITSVPTSVFYSCYRLTQVQLPDSVESIGGSAFSSCSALVDINIPDKVTSIGGGAFYDCRALQSINIPDGVTSISSYAFFMCCGLTSVLIPGSVESIWDYAFNSCLGLSKIRFDGTTPPAVSNSNALLGIPTSCIISVPVGCLEAYKTAANYPSPSKYTYVEE